MTPAGILGGRNKKRSSIIILIEVRESRMRGVATLRNRGKNLK